MTDGPTSGKYVIFPGIDSDPPPPSVGTPVGGAINPVLVGGFERAWIVTRQSNGNYTLLFETAQPWFCTSISGDIEVSVEPPPAEWVIVKHNGPEFRGNYTIAVPSIDWPTKAWTAESTEPGTQIKLKDYDRIPRQDQLWKFVPVFE